MNQPLQYEPIYEDSEQYMFTYDLAVASCMRLLDHKLLHISRDNPKRACFVFEKSEELKHDIEAYYNDELKVNPRKYFDSQKMVKNMLYSNV